MRDNEVALAALKGVQDGLVTAVAFTVLGINVVRPGNIKKFAVNAMALCGVSAVTYGIAKAIEKSAVQTK